MSIIILCTFVISRSVFPLDISNFSRKLAAMSDFTPEVIEKFKSGRAKLKVPVFLQHRYFALRHHLSIFDLFQANPTLLDGSLAKMSGVALEISKKVHSPALSDSPDAAIILVILQCRDVMLSDEQDLGKLTATVSNCFKRLL